MRIDSQGVYTGEIDWNGVYREYYQLDHIEKRLLNYLDMRSSVCFCGFGEIANRLSAQHDVHFIEYSQSMVQFAEQHFQSIDKITHADILETVAHDGANILFVVCRISAYWRSAGDFEKFFSVLKEQPRELVVVDFFDAAKLEGSQALPELQFSDIHQLSDSVAASRSSESVSVLLATVQGTYTIGGKSVPYSEIRAFYNLDEVRCYLENTLYEYEVSVETPIVDGDPGFTVVLRSNAAR